MKKKFLLLIILGCLTAGCGEKLPYYRAYDGPFLRKNQVVILAVPGAVREMKIDGEEIRSGDPNISEPFKDNQTVLVEVPRRIHQLDFEYYVGLSGNGGEASYFWSEYRNGNIRFDPKPSNGYYMLCLKYDEIDSKGRLVKTAPYIVEVKPFLDNSVWERRRQVYREQCKANPKLRMKK